jgi:hypothetical protein
LVPVRRRVCRCRLGVFVRIRGSAPARSPTQPPDIVTLIGRLGGGAGRNRLPQKDATGFPTKTLRPPLRGRGARAAKRLVTRGQLRAAVRATGGKPEPVAA